jgi:putative peptide zinc metalloprotease protein
MYAGPLPSLLPGLPIAFHVDRNGRWYSMRTPENRFIRMGCKEYLVACLLDGRKTAEEVYLAVQEAECSVSIDQMEVIRIVDWLGKAGLLMSKSTQSAGSSAAPTLNPLFVRQNLISGPTMELIGRTCSVLVGRWFAPFAMVLWFVAMIAAIANWDSIWSFSQTLFVPDSLLWWGCAWVFLKIFHEIGHATYAVKYGCRIQSAGVCWMFFSPVPFVDVSGMWLNTNRWQRCLCCLGGLIFELTVSSIALLIFLVSTSEPVQYICCLLFTLGAVSSIVVNGTPFMKFDGYHVVSEWLTWPNLYADGQAATKNFLAKIACPWRASAKPIRPLLVIYGLLCAFYRFTFWLAMLTGAFFTFHILGFLVVATILIVCVLFPPIRRGIRAVRQHAELGQPAISFWRNLAQHSHAILWCGILTLALGAAVCWMPTPWTPMIPGFVDYQHPHLLRNETEGFVAEVHVRPGDRVHQGDLLAVLSNPALEHNRSMKELEVISLREQSVLLRSQQALGESQVVNAKLEAALEQLEQLQHKIEALTIRSPCDGRVVDSYLHERIGQFLKSGDDLGMITENEQLEVVGFVDQSDFDLFRTTGPIDLRIRLPEGTVASAQVTEALPRASDYLDSPQLAANFGGPLSVEIEDAEDGAKRWKLPKPRFKIKAALPLSHGERIRPGQSVGLYLPHHSVSLLRSLLRVADNYWDDIQQRSSANGS